MAPLIRGLLIWVNKEECDFGTVQLLKMGQRRLIPALQNELSPSASDIIEYTLSCLGNNPDTGLNSSVHFELGTVI